VAAYGAGKRGKGRRIKWKLDLVGCFRLDEFEPHSSEIINVTECDENRVIARSRSLLWLNAGVMFKESLHKYQL